MYSRHSLAADFAALGVAAGDVVMLHASIRAVGAVAGGPDQIHLALKDALTSEGTLFMYASCPRHYDEIGRGNLSAAEEAELLEKLPPFDGQTARSDPENGALVELLRTYPGTQVNDHVARFAAWGRDAAHLLAPQPWDYALGAGSIFERFVERDGRILLLGSDHDNVTFLHYAEHIVDIPDKRILRYKVPVLEKGVRVWKDMAEVDSSQGAHASWTEHFFAEIVDSYLESTGNTGEMVGDARAYLLEARALLRHALDTMRRTAGGADSSLRSE